MHFGLKKDLNFSIGCKAHRALVLFATSYLDEADFSEVSNQDKVPQ